MTQVSEPHEPSGEPNALRPETLAEIGDQMLELRLYLPPQEVRYTRLLTVPGGTQQNGEISLETTEKLTGRHTRSFSLDIPRTGEPGEPEHGRFLFARDTAGRLLAVPCDKGTPPFDQER